MEVRYHLMTTLTQTLAGSQGGVEQRRGLIEDLGDDQRLVDTLAGGLAALRITRDDDLVLERLHGDLVLMTFLVAIAHGIHGVGTGGDQALVDTFDSHIGGSRHSFAPICVDVANRGFAAEPSATLAPVYSSRGPSLPHNGRMNHNHMI
jgi:hypothetical protein